MEKKRWKMQEKRKCNENERKPFLSFKMEQVSFLRLSSKESQLSYTIQWRKICLNSNFIIPNIDALIHILQ